MPECAVPPGAPVPLPAGATAWRVDGGAVEAYVDDAHGRHFIGEIASGQVVFGVDDAALTILLVSEMGSTLSRLNAPSADMAGQWCALLAQQGLALTDADAATLKPEQQSARATLQFARQCADKRRAQDAALVRRIASQHDADGPGSLRVALAQAARALGGAVPPRIDGPPTAFDRAPTLALRHGLRASRVTLPADWAADDRGPLLVAEQGTGVVHFLQWSRGGYGVDAAAIGPVAYRLHAPLAANVGRLWAMVVSVARGIPSEIVPIGGAALGVSVLGLVLPQFSGWLFDSVIPSGEAALLLAVAGALLVVALGTYMVGVVRALAVSRVRGRGSTAMAAAINDHVLRLPAAFFRTMPSGDLAQRIVGMDAVRGVVTDVLLSSGLTLLFAVVTLAQLFWFDTALALGATLFTALLAAATLAFRAMQMQPQRRAAAASGRLSSLTFELLSSIAKLRTAAAEARMLARWQAVYDEERDAAAAADRIDAHHHAFQDIWSVLTMLALFAVGAILSGAGLTAGSFIAFLASFGLFQSAFGQFVDGMMALWALQPLAERAQPILAAAPEGRAGLADPGALSGAISVTGLSFAYDGAQVPILDGLDFTVACGEHLAIVGGSGSGKSTILRLLLGFETPLTGSITYDGQDFAGLDPSLVRAQIGAVLQTSQLFAGSILQNIQGASSADLATAMAAAEAAGLAHDLRLFPMGLHTPITEGAGTLSGGQRQRILIARALAGAPPILFLDEATSALDNATQAIVAATMDAMAATRITIAHRLSTVRNADRIAVLERGRFVETGNFETLMARNGAFAALARRQLLED